MGYGLCSVRHSGEGVLGRFGHAQAAYLTPCLVSRGGRGGGRWEEGGGRRWEGEGGRGKVGGRRGKVGGRRGKVGETESDLYGWWYASLCG